MASSTDSIIQVSPRPPPPQPLLLRVPSRAAVSAAGDREKIPYCVSFSVPASPSGTHLAALSVRGDGNDVVRETKIDIEPPPQRRLSSHPSLLIRGGGDPPAMARSDSARTRDPRRFDHFKTFSGRLERQLSSLRGAMPSADIETAANSRRISEEDVAAGDADATETAILPEDETWPFLLRFPITTFGICLGVSSQAMLWKTLATEPSTSSIAVNLAAVTVSHALWWLSVTVTAVISSIYLLKLVFFFEAVRREFHHPIRVNFFFAPWVASLFLVKGSPPPPSSIHHLVWFLLMSPVFALDVAVYGQWMSGGERRLSKVANPTNHLAVVGNFVGALLGARMGMREFPVFFFAVGLAHYAVLFVTLYQRLPTNVQLPRELHPVFFLFVAAPSVAAMAWARLAGEFDAAARMAYFVAIFLYVSLAARVDMFFRGVRFSLAWWAYTFPVTSAAIATAMYATEVSNVFTRSLAVGLAGIATVTVAGVLVTTVYHAFVRRDLFPNDVSIAITKRKPRFSKILAQLRRSSGGKGVVVSVSDDSDECSKASSGDRSPMAHDGAGR
uniref:Uncharacterized protein n=1 Tax=Leersia perrieri TaxID=77586 RepID=A0A0D9WKB1_9ORYZ